jgi:hypothetical protein
MKSDRLGFQTESRERREQEQEFTSNKGQVVLSDRDEGHDMSEENI